MPLKHRMTQLKIQLKSNNDATPVRVFKDIEFLMNSCEIMTENGEEEGRLSAKSTP